MTTDRFIEHGAERIEYAIVRSARRTVAISIERDGAVVVRAPHGASERGLRRIVCERATWVSTKRREIITRRAAAPPLPAASDVALLAEARRVLPERLDACWEVFARPGEVKPTLRIRLMRSRWGSLIAGCRMSLNARLVQAPVPCIDSVVFHELCHLRVAGHGPEFYRELARYVPEWKARRAELRQLYL